MTQDEIMELLRQTGALSEGHFRLTSGLHADFYIQMAMLLRYPDKAELLCRDLAQKYKDMGIQAVIGPATGAIIMAHELARILGVKSMFTERENGKMVLRRGFEVSPGDKVLVCEDVVTTGSSVVETIETVRAADGEVVGAAVFVDRSGGKADLGAQYEALVSISPKTYDPDSCPLCARGMPVVKPGSRQI